MNKIKRSNIAIAYPYYTISEEIVNSILHGIGVIGATAGLVLLTLRTLGFLGGQREGGLVVVATIIFSITMIAMFLISTLYHAIQHQGAKRILRKMDHSVIFIFIAGTYTPFCLAGLGGAWGWGFFAFEWSLAALGITLNILGNKKFKKIEVAAYIMMGWAIVVGIIPLARAVPIQSIILVIAGGIAYTLGTLWYRRKEVKYSHSIWHFFVIIGTVCHWFSIWYLF